MRDYKPKKNFKNISDEEVMKKVESENFQKRVELGLKGFQSNKDKERLREKR